MKLTRTTLVLDAADLDAVSSFWAALLGGTVQTSDDWHQITVDGQPRLAIQLAPGHVQPQWPGGVPQQMHLDLYVEDIAAAHEEAVGIGARLLQAAEDLSATSGFQVYADPAGHPFCLCW
jgi:predicted enzyme related to lactoylglutathione lyase